MRLSHRGGNLARADLLTLTTSVLGGCAGRVLTRAGARVGDGIFVTGTVGGAALGLRVLQRVGAASDDETTAAARARFLAPRARLDLAPDVAAVASAAVDLSDGLVQDLAHVCRASQVGAHVEFARVPLLPGFRELAQQLALDPRALALAGGEDYELLFTAARDTVPAQLATCIGTITDPPQPPAPPVTVLDADGRALPGDAGFDHFSAR